MHASLLRELIPPINGWNAKSSIGALLCSFLARPDILKNYEIFVARYDVIQRHLDYDLKEVKPFQKYVEGCTSETMGCGRMYLDSLLICVVQRLPRYELLFRDMLK